MSGDPVDAENDDRIQRAMKEAKELIRMLETTTVRQLSLKSGELEISIERVPGEAGATVAVAPVALATVEQHGQPGLYLVRAPLVGIFYQAPSPGAKPFVEEGTRVERGQTIGIIETMKVMNEITSDSAGVVVDVFVPNGQAVQYDEVLVSIDTES